MVKDICPVCKKEFEIKYNKQRFCSTKCANKLKRKSNIIINEKDYAYMLITYKGKDFKFLIDFEDIKKIENLKWHVAFFPKSKIYYAYAFERKNQKVRKKLALHRYIMDCPDDKCIDHINHNTFDNRKQNLRICTKFENSLNKTNNKSGCVGVCWDNTKNKWRASIRMNYKPITLGYFENFDDAVKVRKQAEEQKIMYNKQR